MKQELKVLDGGTNWSETIKQHQDEYQSLKAQFERERTIAQRKDVFHGHDMKLEAMHEQTKSNTKVLKDAQKELHGTESNAVDVMATLDDQTAQIKGIKAKAAASNNLLENMGKTLKKMKRRWWA